MGIFILIDRYVGKFYIDHLILDSSALLSISGNCLLSDGSKNLLMPDIAQQLSVSLLRIYLQCLKKELTFQSEHPVCMRGQTHGQHGAWVVGSASRIKDVLT